MPNRTLLMALQESVADALEKMFFIRAFEEPLETPNPSTAFLIAQVAFDGDAPGSLTLRTTLGAARSLAADFLGSDEGTLSKHQVDEVVCELANMICGSVLSRMESRAVFRLGRPRILSPEELIPLAGVAVPCASATASTTIGLAESGDEALTVTITR